MFTLACFLFHETVMKDYHFISTTKLLRPKKKVRGRAKEIKKTVAKDNVLFSSIGFLFLKYSFNLFQ